MNETNSRPLVAVTMGDPSGVGPGLVMRVVAEKGQSADFQVVVIGDAGVMQKAADVVGTDTPIVPVESSAQLAGVPAGSVAVYKPDGLNVSDHQWGVLDPKYGRAAAICLEAAFDLKWGFDAVVSAPLNKESFHNAGYDYPDELAYMADLTESSNTCVAGLAGGIWSISVTEHVAFASIIPLLSEELILHRIEVIDDILARVSPGNRKIAVASLNPHGGDGGLMGNEEQVLIGPAVQTAAGRGVEVTGPVPADTVFVSAAEGRFAGVVCLYHDQANIARKLLSLRSGATLFTGLPVPVTTTAHGTAFDIAGTGAASPDSLATALDTAVALSGTP